MTSKNKLIASTLEGYIAELQKHPFLQATAHGQIPSEALKEFAFYQYSDSILWVPMLALMKSKAVKSKRLRSAIEDNLCCETGIGSVSHVELARAMMRSLDIRSVEGFPAATFQESASLWLSDTFDSFNEPEVAGWLFAAESLVPIMFALALPAFQKIAGGKLEYFSEHVHVDSDEHSAWMAESVDEILSLYGSAAEAQVLAGMQDAWEETISIPTLLWDRICA